MVSKHVIYSGRVQGVGFRYTAHRLAQGFAVSGFVRNLSDGRVELGVEGPAADVDAFLDAVAAAMADGIDSQTTQDEQIQGFKGFHIKA